MNNIQWNIGDNIWGSIRENVEKNICYSASIKIWGNIFDDVWENIGFDINHYSFKYSKPSNQSLRTIQSQIKDQVYEKH